jgi:uncharacterized membrane protein
MPVRIHLRTAIKESRIFMRARASFAKHPFHPMLVAIPIGLFIASFASEAISLWHGSELWRDLTFYNLIGGLIGAVVAAIPGFVDYVSLEDEKVLPLAHRHFGVNVALLSVYSVNLWVRTQSGKAIIGNSVWIPLLLSVLGMSLLGISGWLGGEMVYAHGVAVDVEEKVSESNNPPPD